MKHGSRRASAPRTSSSCSSMRSSSRLIRSSLRTSCVISYTDGDGASVLLRRSTVYDSAFFYPPEPRQRRHSSSTYERSQGMSLVSGHGTVNSFGADCYSLDSPADSDKFDFEAVGPHYHVPHGYYNQTVDEAACDDFPARKGPAQPCANRSDASPTDRRMKDRLRSATTTIRSRRLLHRKGNDNTVWEAAAQRLKTDAELLHKALEAVCERKTLQMHEQLPRCRNSPTRQYRRLSSSRDNKQRLVNRHWQRCKQRNGAACRASLLTRPVVITSNTSSAVSSVVAPELDMMIQGLRSQRQQARTGNPGPSESSSSTSVERNNHDEEILTKTLEKQHAGKSNCGTLGAGDARCCAEPTQAECAIARTEQDNWGSPDFQSATKTSAASSLVERVAFRQQAQVGFFQEDIAPSRLFVPMAVGRSVSLKPDVDPRCRSVDSSPRRTRRRRMRESTRHGTASNVPRATVDRPRRGDPSQRKPGNENPEADRLDPKPSSRSGGKPSERRVCRTTSRSDVRLMLCFTPEHQELRHHNTEDCLLLTPSCGITIFMQTGCLLCQATKASALTEKGKGTGGPGSALLDSGEKNSHRVRMHDRKKHGDFGGGRSTHHRRRLERTTECHSIDKDERRKSKSRPTAASEKRRRGGKARSAKSSSALVVRCSAKKRRSSPNKRSGAYPTMRVAQTG